MEEHLVNSTRKMLGEAQSFWSHTKELSQVITDQEGKDDLPFVVVQLLSFVQLFATPQAVACQAPVCSTISWSLLKLMSIKLVMLSNNFIICCPLLLLPQSFLASGSFPMSRLFTSGDQNIGALASVLPMNIQGWFPLGLTGLISLQSKGLTRVFFSTIIWKALILWHSAFFMIQLSHSYTTTGKTTALTIHIFVFKVMSVLFNMLSRVVIAFLPRSKHLLISWLQSLSTVIWSPPKIKICHCFHFSPFYLPWSDETRCNDLNLFNVEFQASFFTLLFHPDQEAL